MSTSREAVRAPRLSAVSRRAAALLRLVEQLQYFCPWPALEASLRADAHALLRRHAQLVAKAGRRREREAVLP